MNSPLCSWHLSCPPEPNKTTHALEGQSASPEVDLWPLHTHTHKHTGQ